ncbi:hypothetical protein ES703_94731 [subsurface metagenome]
MTKLIRFCIITLVVILLATTIFSTGCGNVPSAPVTSVTLVESITGDGSGGAIIAYEIDRSDKDEDIRLQRMGADGTVLWDKILFTSQSNRSSMGGMSGDGEGSIIIYWTVLVPQNGGGGRSYSKRTIVARADTQGQVLWQKDINKKDVQAINDGSGGAIIIWPDGENLYVQHIGGDGNLLWGKHFPGSGRGLKIISDDKGGAIFLWDNRDNHCFVVQKLSPSGEALWGKEGIFVEYAASASEQLPQIISDGSGGAILTWAELMDGVQPSYVWVLKIGVDGKVLWKSPVHDLALPPINTLTRVVRDEDSAIVVWEDLRQGMSLYVQKVSTEGNPLWLENGAPVCTNIPRVSPRFEVVSNGDGGVVVVWIDGDSRLYAQMLDYYGQRLWSEEGILIATGACHQPIKLCGDSQSGFIIGWGTGKEIYHPDKSYLQKLDSTGNLLWGDKGIRLNP